MIFDRKKESSDMYWMQLLLLSQQNTLAIAYSLLSVIDNPEIVDDDTREELASMIEQLEYGIAQFEEHVVL